MEEEGRKQCHDAEWISADNNEFGLFCVMIFTFRLHFGRFLQSYFFTGENSGRPSKLCTPKPQYGPAIRENMTGKNIKLNVHQKSR